MRANMEIVERYNHSYAVGYVPDGMDATVYYKSLDFRFKNDKDRPIKITCSMQGRTLTVNIYGTKENDNTVKITNKVLSTSPYKTIYQEDASIKSGKKVKTTGYTGKTVETYRSIYDANGNLISSKLEAVSRYKTRNKNCFGSRRLSGRQRTHQNTGSDSHPEANSHFHTKANIHVNPNAKTNRNPHPQPDPTPVPLPESA